MKNIDKELVEWAIQKIESEYKEDVALLIGQVGGDDFVEPALFIGRVENVEAVCEQAEGGAYKDAVGMHLFLDLPGGIQHGAARGNHIVNKN